MSINESFEKKVAEESAKNLFQLVWSTVSSFGKKTIDEIKVVIALQRYTKNYLRRHGQVKVLGMPESVSLIDIYTSVRIVSMSYLYKENKIEHLEDNFRATRGSYSTHERISGIDIANKKSSLNILGAPGSGKSTFLKRMGLEALLRNTEYLNSDSGDKYTHECIPVLIELKRFKSEEVNLKQAIQQEFEIAGLPESDYFVNDALKNGQLLILLDGLDEVPKSVFESTIEHIRDFTHKYSKNRFITSCRTAFYKTFLTDFTDVEIASFDNIQIQKFIRNWFSLEKDRITNTSDRFIDLLFDRSNRATLELARTPLLLTFLCLTFDESQRFPSNRSNLYKRALYILLERWAAEKRIHNDDIYQDLNSDIEIEMLSEIAANFYVQDKIFFYSSEVKERIKMFIENTLNVKAKDISKILEAIEIQQGLLVQRAPDIYSFSHLTIQEYLTAHFYHSSKKIEELINNNLLDERWREVFLLQAGIANADNLLLSMSDWLKAYIITDSLLLAVIKWINTVISDIEDYEENACRKVFLLSLLLRYKRYDPKAPYNSDNERLEKNAIDLITLIRPRFAQAHDLKKSINKKDGVKIFRIVSTWQNDSIDYSNSIEKINTITPDRPVSNMIMGSKHKYLRTLLEPIYVGLQVPDNLGNLPKKKYDGILKYLEAYKLIIDCKNSSLRLSKDVWRQVCCDLLNLPD